MAETEMFHGPRDRTYSAWHRTKSLERYVGGIEQAQLVSMIDLDAFLYVEYDKTTQIPIVLLETAVDYGQSKSATVTKNLARMADIPAWVVLYTKAPHKNPADINYRDIQSFRVRRVWPEYETAFESVSPELWATFLFTIRDNPKALPRSMRALRPRFKQTDMSLGA